MIESARRLKSFTSAVFAGRIANPTYWTQSSSPVLGEAGWGL